jgi:hypothetical protein
MLSNYGKDFITFKTMLIKKSMSQGVDRVPMIDHQTAGTLKQLHPSGPPSGKDAQIREYSFRCLKVTGADAHQSGVPSHGMQARAPLRKHIRERPSYTGDDFPFGGFDALGDERALLPNVRFSDAHADTVIDAG